MGRTHREGGALQKGKMYLGGCDNGELASLNSERTRFRLSRSARKVPVYCPERPPPTLLIHRHRLAIEGGTPLLFPADEMQFAADCKKEEGLGLIDLNLSPAQVTGEPATKIFLSFPVLFPFAVCVLPARDRLQPLEFDHRENLFVEIRDHMEIYHPH